MINKQNQDKKMSTIQPFTVTAEQAGEHCLTCFEDFAEGATRYSHTDKYGFHRDCLAKWVIKHPDCPACRLPLDPTSIISLKDLACDRADQAFQNATLAAITGIAAACMSGLGESITVGLTGGFGLGPTAVGISAGVLTGIGMGIHIFETLETKLPSQQNIAIGAALGALSAPLCAAITTFETTVTAIFLVSSLTAYSLTLLRGY